MSPPHTHRALFIAIKNQSETQTLEFSPWEQAHSVPCTEPCFPSQLSARFVCTIRIFKPQFARLALADMQGSSVASPHLGRQKFLPGKSAPSDTSFVWGLRNGSWSGENGSNQLFLQWQESWKATGTPKCCSGLSPIPRDLPIARDSAASPLHSDIPVPVGYFRVCSQPPQPHNFKKKHISIRTSFPTHGKF